MQKREETDLFESRQLLRAIIDSEPECVKLVASDGTLIMMNRAGLDMIQVESLESVKGQSLYTLVMPEYREAFRKLTQEVFQGKAGNLVFEAEGTKGRRLWLDTHAVPLRSGNNEIVALLGITRDITERKKSEEVLKKERDFTSAVLDTVGSMILVLDRNGKVIRFNRTCEQVSGYTFEEVRERYVWDFLLPPEQVDEVKKVFSNLVAGMLPNNYENYWVAKNGQRRLIAWSNTALLDSNGSIEYVIPTGIDITEHRRTEEAFQREKIFTDTIIDSLPGTFNISDEQGRLIRWNNNEMELTGYSTEELTNMNVLDFFREDRELVQSKMKEVLASGKASVEARLMTKSRVPIPFLFSGFRMSLDGKQYVVGVGVDISERRRLEDQLRQSQKMESVGTLAGGIAHDFNNILTAIIGYGNLLQMKMKSDDPLRHNVEQILASANRATTLTQSLLAYSRKQIMNPQPVKINELIRKVEKLLAPLLGEDVALKSILADTDMTVLADAGQIEQVLMNLASNARDAMPGGGNLYIEAQRTELDEDGAKTRDLRPGAYTVITVTDSGMGMDEKTKARIFEPFFTTKDQGKGTGLGLAVVYGIVRQHGGHVEVESDPGMGAAFRIYLPVHHMPADEVLSVKIPPIEGGSETILVAEDDETVRYLTSNVLEQYGYTVIQAVDGEDAVKKFMVNKEKVKLLLLDIIMPKKNGREVLEKIRIFQPDINVLFLSGYTADIMHQRGLLDEGVNFILKPVPINDLLRKVRSILDRK